MRQAVGGAAEQQTAKLRSFPAPTGGWVANQNLAQPNLGPNGLPAPKGATVLQNWIPTATGAIMRRGSELWATLGQGVGPVRSLFVYANGNNESIFGASDSAIYDITLILTPFNYFISDEAGDVIVTDTGDTFGEDSTNDFEKIAGQTSGDWSVVQFATPGGTFLRLVNGVDTPLVYDGANFVTTPALTVAAGQTLDVKKLSNVWNFKSRLFFIEKESMNAWYLPSDSIGGQLAKFPLGGVFNLGGSLVFGYSWSIDQTNGLNAFCVFITSEGEVAVYQGSDPSAVATFGLVGVYRIGKPLGPKAFIHNGGDIDIATDIGFIPLSQAMQRDYAALSPSAISYNIETEWNRAVTERSALPWHMAVWSDEQMVVIALPTPTNTAPVMFIANSRTGAWAEFTNWDGTCLQVFQKRLFFGSQDGKVVQANVSGLDQGQPYTATYVPLFDDLRTPGSLKITQMARAVLRSSVAVNEQVSVMADFVVSLPPAPDAVTIGEASAWGVGIWGKSKWDDRRVKKVLQDWHSVGNEGYALAPSIQITSGALIPLDAEIIRLDLAYEIADIIT